MIYKPEPKVMEAFARLRGNPNFMTIMEFVRDCRDRTDREGAKHAEEYKVRWAQGASQDLTELLNLLDMSKSL